MTVLNVRQAVSDFCNDFGCFMNTFNNEILVFNYEGIRLTYNAEHDKYCIYYGQFLQATVPYKHEGMVNVVQKYLEVYGV